MVCVTDCVLPSSVWCAIRTDAVLHHLILQCVCVVMHADPVLTPCDPALCTLSDQEAGVCVFGALCRGAAGCCPPLHLHLPEGPEGPQPADQRVRPKGPLQYSRSHHRTYSHALN